MERSNKRLIAVLAGCGGVLILAICGLSVLGAWWTCETKPQTVQPPGARPDPAGGPPGPQRPRSPSGPPSGRVDAGGADPQRPPPPGAPSKSADAAPRIVSASVTEVGGTRPVSVGDRCGFTVERHRRRNGYWCRTQVVCGGKLLYGGPRAGYFECTVSDDPEPGVVGGEDETTRQDGDAAFRVDTEDRRVFVRDDAAGDHGAYSLEARITRVK